MQVSWKQVQGNPLLQGLHPKMLTLNGHVVNRTDRLIGTSKYSEKVLLEVVFDRDFVMKYFVKMVFEKLQVTDWNSFQALASEAWKKYKAGEDLDGKSENP